ncbi:MAG: nickel-dependent lactate racemase [Pyrinomonadaceae bacterium MAG19_C2-C3]|nr:nickel-dependent lactate racemase [Pyrinomonadaceae bacterium MAG19_C2-C3]
MPLQLRRKTHESVVHIDRDSAPRIVAHGTEFLLEDLPVGTRVIYPNAPIKGLPNPEAAIRYALNHPHGCDPLHAQLEPGMRVTIAVDDISMPLPPMQTPDIRQTVLEILVDMLHGHGVDDVHIIIAVSLHRHMTESEMKRMSGERVFKDFYPDRYYNHDAEDESNLVELGKNRHGEPLRINRRAAESDLLIYVNLNFVPMNGGHKSVGVGLCDYESLRAHHEPHTIRASDSYMDPHGSELARKIARVGVLADEKLNVFHIETTLNNRMFKSDFDFLTKNEDDFSAMDRIKFEAMRFSVSKLPRKAKLLAHNQLRSNYELIAVHAGKTDPVHDKIIEKSMQQYVVPIEGQCDILICPIPELSPYNVNTNLNPLLVQVMALGYHFNMYRGKPLLKKGGVLILHHPCHDEFDHKFHPSYIEFFNRLLPESRDACYLRDKYEREFAANPSYISMYRRGNAYHGAHPFFMWYWGENGRAHVGKVIAAGAENAHVPARMGWERSDNLTEAIAMARSYMGRNAEITMLHQPVIAICDVT